MFIFKRVHHLQDHVAEARQKGLRIGFVPTMGALHEGHLSLVKLSREKTDLTIVSIFVNPKQFNDPEDLKKYPRPVNQDLRMLNECGTDVVFLPEVDDIYPSGLDTKIQFDPGPAALTMEGKFRPGHFTGMAEVVYRLLDITRPDQLYMGQKDFQQFSIIRKLIHDFHLPMELVMCPIIREPNGLAMSSRNVRLSPSTREKAGIIHHVLEVGKNLFDKGEPTETIQQMAFQMLQDAGFEPEYFDVVNGYTLEPVGRRTETMQVVACVAVRAEGVRLIDNMIWQDNI
jgi:pantoate--beta-alanine ligase